MFKNKYALVLLLLFGALLGIGAVYTGKFLIKSKPEVVTIRVWEENRSILYLPLYVAISEGFFKEQNIRVELMNRSDARGADPYAVDLADIIITDPVDCLYRKSVNPDSPVIIAALANREGSFLLARKKEPFTWDNLKGKNVITFPPETTSGFAMDKLLRDKSITPMRDICLYNRISSEFRLGAFKAGSGSYIQLSGPDALAAQKNGTGHIIATLGKEAGPFPSALCAAWPTAIKKHPQAVQGFVNGIYKAQLWMREEPDLGAKAARVYLKDLNRETRDQILQRYQDMGMWSPNPWVDVTVYKDIESAMETAALLAVPVGYDKAVNNTFALRASDSVKYIPKDERNKGLWHRIFG